jgi:hypothetical protein
MYPSLVQLLKKSVKDCDLYLGIDGNRYWTLYRRHPISDIELFSPILDRSNIIVNLDIVYWID